MSKIWKFGLLILILILVMPLATSAQDCPAGRVCLKNPLSFIDVSSPGALVLKAFQGFIGIMAVIAIAFTVFSGVKLIVATSEEAIQAARTSITWSVGGFVVALLSFTIVSGVANLLGFKPSLADVEVDRIQSPLSDLRLRDPRDFVSVLEFVMLNFLVLVGAATIFMIIYYGYRYITSAGNEEAIEQAKTGLKWAILGFVVVILAFAIINIVRQALLTPL